MKKIIFLLFIIITISSCGITNKKNGEEKQEKIVKQEINKTTKQESKSILEIIPENDIRKKTKYPTNFELLQKDFFNNNQNIGLLLTYIENLEYQGIVEKKQKDYAKIIVKMGEEFIKNIPNNTEIEDFEKKDLVPELERKIAIAYNILGENDKAIELYKKLIKQDPNDYILYIELGKIYKQNGNKQKFQEMLSQARKIIKENDIINKINKGIEMFEGNYGGYIKLGFTYNILGETDKAIKSFNKAKEIINNSEHINDYEKQKLFLKIKKYQDNI